MFIMGVDGLFCVYAQHHTVILYSITKYLLQFYTDQFLSLFIMSWPSADNISFPLLNWLLYVTAISRAFSNKKTLKRKNSSNKCIFCLIIINLDLKNKNLSLKLKIFFSGKKIFIVQFCLILDFLSKFTREICICIHANIPLFTKSTVFSILK